MSPRQPVDHELERAARRVAPRLRLLPVVHDRLESAVIVRAALDRFDPAAVAVELPASLAAAAEAAVRRLPRISVALSWEQEDEPLLWVASPADPLVEGLRWALARERRIFWIDPDLPYPPRHRDPVPDPYAVWSLGAARYLELVTAVSGGETEADRARELATSHRLRRAVEETDGEVVALVGAAHAARLAELVAGDPPPHPFSRRRRPTVELRHLDPDSLTAILPDPPLVHAVWERLRGAEDAGEPGAAGAGEAALESAVSRPVSVTRFGLRLITGQKDEDERRRRRSLVRWVAAQTVAPLAGQPAPDRRRLGGAVWRLARDSYRAQTGESLATWQRRLFFDYAGRTARLQGHLVPGLFDWVVSGRGVADDNLAWEVFDAVATYPGQEAEAEIPVARLDGEDLDLGTRKVRFRRRFRRAKSRPIPVPVRHRRRPVDPAEWLRGFDSAGLCSYPPEDLVIEDYGRFLGRKAVSVLSTERRRVEPFTTSFLDGIDLRETLRNLEDGRIYVRDDGRAPGEAGSVVVIFDADKAGGAGPGAEERFPFLMTWLGEHDQESDMAFYSTDPAEQVVGPGIVRATYGGFMLTMPRGRLADVWTDPDYRWAASKPEVLIQAAIDYSEQTIVVHVAARPPAGRWKSYAAARGRKLVHLPLAALGGATLKKIRVVHLLAGHDKRTVARDYIW